MNTIVHTFNDLTSLSTFGAEKIADCILGAVEQNGLCTLVLAGGTTPRLLYEHLAEMSKKSGTLPWHKTHLFWGDERFVPPTDVRSNYLMVAKTLLSGIEIPPRNIHPMETSGRPVDAAAAYQRHIQTFFTEEAGRAPGEMPVFDLVLLGMGADGHTASLFPGSDALREQHKLVVPATAPAGVEPVDRITLTLPVLCHAEQVMFVISGPDKKKICDEIQRDRLQAAAHYPAANITATNELLWIVARE